MSDFLSTLPPDRLHALAAIYSDLTYASGLAVTKEDGRTLPIPPVLTPVVISDAELAARTRLARVISEAVAKVAKAVLGGPQRNVLLDAMAPLEREVVEKTWADIPRVPNVRVDFFLDEQGTAKVLEINATIPAMQGYSDIAASSFIRAVGHARGMNERQITELISRNGSNTLALLSALMTAYRARGGLKPSPTLGLLARRNDAQHTELMHLARTFTGLGTPAFVIHPDELMIEGNDLIAGGRRIDLLYRHIFARRVELTSPLAAMLREPSRFMFFNPVDPQLEEKGTLALLSEAALDDGRSKAYGLTDEERKAVREAVPWTRRLVAGPTTDADGKPVADLLAWVRSEPKRFVLKRSWDYGGKAVFVGPALDEPGAAQRMEECFGGALDWPGLVDKCAADPRGGGFVVQQFVQSPKREQLVCEANGALRKDAMYVDFSAYASIGLDAQGWGGVCRASGSPIVNIVGGGGVAPLLREEVAKILLG